MSLTPTQFRELHEAVLSAFPEVDTLSQLVLFRLEVYLPGIVSVPGSALSDVVFKLIIWAEAHGRTEELIQGVLEEIPGNKKVKAYVDRWRSEINTGSGSVPTEIPPPSVFSQAEYDQGRQDILDYLAREGFTKVSFEGIRKYVDPAYSDEFLMDVIRHNKSIFRRAILKGDKPGVTKIGSGSKAAPKLEALQLDQATETRKDRSANLERYELIHPIYQGHYSRVNKCLVRETGEICIVKETAADRVCFNALKALQNLGHSNIAVPRRVWEENDKVYEELPYIGGIRLSKAVATSVGGLTGSILESFHDQLVKVLSRLHESQIIHRDIHPDNIYMVIKRDDGFPQAGKRSPLDDWEYDRFGSGSDPFLLAWVLVDCTFATLLSEANKARYRHGSYTPEDQEVGAVSSASDMYAFGATIYYGITGCEIPSFQTRRKNPSSLSVFPGGSHPSVQFPQHLERLLSLDPSNRPRAPYHLQLDTIMSGFTGALQVSEDTLLIADHFASETRLLKGQNALSFLHTRRARYSQESQGEQVQSSVTEALKEADYWINKLHQAGIEG